MKQTECIPRNCPGYPEAAATLAGSYRRISEPLFSNGGGIIGAGENPEPNTAARRVVAEAADLRGSPHSYHGVPLRQKAYTRFYIITPNVILTSEAKEDNSAVDGIRCPTFLHGSRVDHPDAAH